MKRASSAAKAEDPVTEPGPEQPRDLTNDPRWALAQRIAESRHFEHSIKLRELLLYICRRSLEDPSASISEHEIGCKVFGRPEDFDTRGDTIARVHASRLRRRLEQYFSTDGQGEPLTLSVPPGGYNPVWEVREKPARPVSPAPDLSRPRALVLLLSTLCAVLTVICMSLAVQSWRLRGPVAGQVTPTAELDRFWQQVWAKDRPTYIVLSDSNLSLWNEMMGRELSLDEYLARAYESFPAGRDSGLARIVMQRYHTSVVSAQIACRLVRLGPAPPQIVFARELSARQLQHGGSAILIGSRHSNPWVESFDKAMKFRLAGSGASINNLAPEAGEPAQYVRDQQHGYAHVAFVPNLSGGGNVVFLAGTESQSTEAAGALLTTERGILELQRALRVAPGKAYPYFEIVLQATLVGPTGTEPKIVAQRVIETRKTGR